MAQWREEIFNQQYDYVSVSEKMVYHPNGNLNVCQMGKRIINLGMGYHICQIIYPVVSREPQEAMSIHILPYSSQIVEPRSYNQSFDKPPDNHA